MAEPHSGELLLRSNSGDAVALQHLMQRHWPALRAFVRARMSPELRAQESGSDLVQSTMRQLLEELDGFEYRGEAAFRSWLYTAVLHRLHKRERGLRAHKRDVRRQVVLPEDSAPMSLGACYSQALSPSRAMMAEEEVRALEAALDTLSDDYREVIALSRIARLPRAEVARRMDRSEGSVRNLLHRALVALAQALDRAGVGDGEESSIG